MSKFLEWVLLALLHVAGDEVAVFLRALAADEDRMKQLDVITDGGATREQKRDARHALVGRVQP